MGEVEPTEDEARAIRSLQRLARNWPESLWLYSAGGSLHVMRKGPGGHERLGGGDLIDPDYSLATIDIENSGGDW